MQDAARSQKPGGTPRDRVAAWFESHGNYVTTLVLAACGIAIAAMGQAQTTRTLSDRLQWLAPHARQVTDVYTQPKPVLAGMTLLVIGAAIFVFASWGWIEKRREGAVLDPPGRGIGLRLPADYLPALAGLLAVVPLLVLVIRLCNGHYSHWLIAVWIAALGLAAVPFAARDLRPLPVPKPRWNWRVLAEAVFALAMALMYAIINVRDLTHWRFSAEGDEYAFWETGRQIAEGGPFNLFAQNGTYGYHPIMSAAYQAAFMKLLGGDIFAWKLSIVILVSATLIVFYLLLRELFNWRVAMFGTALMAASHYLFGFTHTGFISLNALFPTVLSLWLLAIGLRRDSALALYASGAAAGLGFYALFSARATILIIGFFMLTLGRKGLRPEKLVPIAVGFALVVAPMFSIHGWDVIDQMIKQSAAEAGEAAGHRVERFFYNFVPSIMAFNYSGNAARYVSGSLLDPISAVLFALGLGLAIGKVRHPAFRLLLVWWALSLAVTGLANPRAEVTITRLHYVIPAACALAAVGLERALAPLLSFAKRPAVEAAAASGMLALVMVPVLFLNLHRALVETPLADGLVVEAVVVRAVVSDECDAPPAAAVVTPFPEGLLRGIFLAYKLGDGSPQLMNYDAVLPGGPLADGQWQGCIIVDPQVQDDPARLEALLAQIRLLYPNKQHEALTDPADSVLFVNVFY
jgi:4-amino-4-deoxy-L-arabinose transferase-like glycosyltransferase